MGLHVTQEDGNITVDQNRYIEELDVPDASTLLSGIEDLNELLDEEGQSEFRTLVGRVGWM